MRRNGKERKDRTSGGSQRPYQEIVGRTWIFRGSHRGRVTKRNIIWHELIGLKVRVVNSMHPGFVGIEGYVVDETRNMLVIVGDKVWKVPKDVCIFEFETEDGAKIKIPGERLVGRPEMRLKKRWRKW
ncbi:ribonuclease P protein component 1 [Pyrococcus abyssi]|uniref:Ribonuclease P protein component 1 n=1 Tax=Pyrococcus abyssi (strain GE5 / Orsay) TaxID=272844 RepID=RNP1_PYRAB|nr:ribonuclease P protein component 1 [Pyrococcus abyssi]Q9V1U4.1 RecName: Full=Ribonuclease P protein component 1; Short=RNase P component 1; AltName: Full=Rpp29 [Pyrococcus abyssi GE5]CAB49255.1 RNAse P protein subunit P29/POP4 [Pyrococcus abyssi GE5]CCE69710.1 TPA: ribonuclease P protein component 1 [Pyrococcus abyssi GE5]